MNSGNWISIWDLIKNRDPMLAGVDKKPSQQESRRIKYILPVLDYAISHRKFSATQLEKKLSISRDSIDRTVKLLKHKKIIVLSNTGIKNEKFYKVTSLDKAKNYQKDLTNWDSFKNMISNFKKSKNSRQKMASYIEIIGKMGKYVHRAIKTQQFKVNVITKDLLETPLHLESKEQQKRLTSIPWPNPVTIKQMKWKEAKKTIHRYEDGQVCKTCLKKNKLRFMTMTPDGLDLVCNEGHSIGITY